MTRITRRHAVTGLAAFFALIGPTQASDRNTRAWQPRTYDDGLIPDFSFELIEMDLQGSLNVYALDTETGRAAVWGLQERVPIGALMPLILVAEVLRGVDAGSEQFEKSRPLYGLCEAALLRSDRSAARSLLDHVGGIVALSAQLALAGDKTTRIAGLDSEPWDMQHSTTAHQAANTLWMYLSGPALSPQSKALLRGWLTAPMDGVPAGWEAAALTGTEGDNTLSVATIFPPDRSPLLLAAFITGANRDPDFQFARHAELVRIATTNLMLPPYDPYADE
ncbi:serine hydrolase [Litoreibacter albidus]|uniref:serine hydrolase n=1 Tax=Litoreibacter albidus TaxID=670155 RepID=UPI00373667DA